MDPLAALFSWQFVLLSLFIAGITFIVRLVMEYYKENLKDQKFWRDVFLPIFPLVLGVVIGATMSKYPYPDGLVSIGGRIVFGMVAGMFSGLVFRVMNAMLKAKEDNPSTTISTTTATEQVSQEVIDSVRNSIQK